MCTDMAEMQVSHPSLMVHVRLMRELEELLPHHAFVVDGAEQNFVVNFVPNDPETALTRTRPPKG
jgi:hypothetical protein